MSRRCKAMAPLHSEAAGCRRIRRRWPETADSHAAESQSETAPPLYSQQALRHHHYFRLLGLPFPHGHKHVAPPAAPVIVIRMNEGEPAMQGQPPTRKPAPAPNGPIAELAEHLRSAPLAELEQPQRKGSPTRWSQGFAHLQAHRKRARKHAVKGCPKVLSVNSRHQPQPEHEDIQTDDRYRVQIIPHRSER